MVRRARRWAGLLALFLVLALGPVVPTGAQTAGDVTADKDGWWSRAQGTPEQAPANPAGGLTPKVPRPPTIPEGTLPVAAAAGDPATVSAIGISVDAPSGSTVNRLTMDLAVSEEPGAQQNAGSAAIVACPITSFWGATDNGEYAERPEADCELAAAAGTRNDDGSWTFDLTAIAAIWFDEFATIGQNGVLLTEAADPPTSFQVAFEGLPDGITFDADITPGSGDDSGFDFGGGAAGGTGGGFGAPGGSRSGSFGGGTAGGGPSFGGGPSTVTPPAADVPPDAGDGGEPAAPGAEDEVASPFVPGGEEQGTILGNLPVAVIVLPLLALLGAVAAGLAVGGPLQPAAVRARREGGVSRALAERDRQRPAPRPTSRPLSEH